jgi:imidazolonepropionase-like amidohydrolase
MVMNMACVNMRMTMKEALVAATINAAGSFIFARLPTHTESAFM